MIIMVNLLKRIMNRQHLRLENVNTYHINVEMKYTQYVNAKTITIYNNKWWKNNNL